MTAKQELKKPIVLNTTFASYRATHIIGEGGSGRIFEAVTDDGYKWAIKLLDAEKATKEKLKRFKNEIQFCLKNKHPNILAVCDHGIFVKDEKNSPFYIMPLYDGSLRQLLQTGIASDKVLHYYAQILNGIEAAHLQGIVHRDIKPENILYDSKNDLLIVADFGIALFEEDELYTAVETKDTTRLANFVYAAPEQRKPGVNADTRADIFALGLILNEMFTKEVPSGDGYKKIASVAPDYEYLDSIVAQMIRQSPQDRFSSIESIKNQLISRKNEFIVHQRINQLKQTVIPTTEPDDPLIADPIRIVNADWNQGALTLQFQQPVNKRWVQALQTMGSHSAVLGKGPETFSFQDNKAIISAQEREVQLIINHFKDWLPIANRRYEQLVRSEAQEAEERQRKQLRQQLEAEETRQRILKNIKI